MQGRGRKKERRTVENGDLGGRGGGGGGEGGGEIGGGGGERLFLFFSYLGRCDSSEEESWRDFYPLPPILSPSPRQTVNFHKA